MLSPKANFLETVKKDGHPDRLPSCYTAFRPIGGDPCFQLIRGNRIRGTESIDAWGTHISFPEDAPAAIPIVTAENQVIQDIEEWQKYEGPRSSGQVLPGLGDCEGQPGRH